MSEKRIAAGLRRLAEREVPDVDLWPAIQARASARGSTPASEGAVTARCRNSAPVPGLASSYTWTADAGRAGKRMRRMSLVAVVGLCLVLVAGLATVLSESTSGIVTPTPLPVSGVDRTAATAPTSAVGRASATPATPPGLVPAQPRMTAPPYPAPASCPITPYATIVPAGAYGIGYTTTWYHAFGIGGTLWAGLDRAYGGNWYAGGLKVMWLREQAGALTITGRRLDGAAPALIADVPDGYGMIGLQASEIDVPVAGCWEIDATAGFQQLRVVVYAYPTGCRQSAWAHDPATPQACSPPPGMPSAAPATCPVTSPQLSMAPPLPYAQDPPPGQFWYGYSALWTSLPVDGIWAGSVQKLFVWRQGYDPEREPFPDLTVTASRLDGPSPLVQGDRATNADDGMLTLLQFPTGGCWEVSA